LDWLPDDGPGAVARPQLLADFDPDLDPGLVRSMGAAVLILSSAMRKLHISQEHKESRALMTFHRQLIGKVKWHTAQNYRRLDGSISRM
jgi:hypothetical protein